MNPYDWAGEGGGLLGPLFVLLGGGIAFLLFLALSFFLAPLFRGVGWLWEKLEDWNFDRRKRRDDAAQRKGMMLRDELANRSFQDTRSAGS